MAYVESPIGIITNVSWAGGIRFEVTAIAAVSTTLVSRSSPSVPCTGIILASGTSNSYTLRAGPAYAVPRISIDDIADLMTLEWTGGTSGATFAPADLTWSHVCAHTVTGGAHRDVYNSLPLYDIGKPDHFPEYYCSLYSATDDAGYDGIFLSPNLSIGAAADPGFSLGEIVTCSAPDS